jgi:hypothetical protein
LSITMMLHRASPNDDQPLRQLDRLVDSERRVPSAGAGQSR